MSCNAHCFAVNDIDFKERDQRRGEGFNENLAMAWQDSQGKARPGGVFILQVGPFFTAAVLGVPSIGMVVRVSTAAMVLRDDVFFECIPPLQSCVKRLG